MLLLGSVLSRFVIVSADHGARVARNNMSGRGGFSWLFRRPAGITGSDPRKIRTERIEHFSSPFFPLLPPSSKRNIRIPLDVFLEGEALRSSVKLFSFSRAIAACPRNHPSDFGKNRFPKSRTKSAVPETNAQRFLFSKRLCSLFFLPFFLRRVRQTCCTYLEAIER